MKKKLSELDKRIIRSELNSLKSITENMISRYPALTKDRKDEMWLREIVGTFVGAVTGIATHLDRIIS